MPNKVMPKRSYTPNAVPTADDLQANELAINWSDGIAYTKDASGQIVSLTMGGGGGSSIDSRWNLFLPPAPTGLAGTAGDTQVSLSWTAPAGVLAQAPVTDYVVQYSSNGGTTWATFADGTSTATTATVTGLTNNTEYTFRVAAVNGVGTGSFGESVAVTPIATQTDPDFASVSLLLHMDGTNGSTSFTDSSGNAFAVTANGNAQISTAQSTFGGASGYFDGGGDYLSVANNADFDFGSGDLAIECWVYIAADAASDVDGNRSANIVNTWSGTSTISGYAFNITGSASDTGTGLAFDTWNSSNGTLYRATATVTKSAWHHVAVSVTSGTRRLYLDGAEISGSTITIGSGYTQADSLGADLRIGMTPNTGYPLPFNGYIDDLRITKGTNRGFTGATIDVPSAAYPNA